MSVRRLAVWLRTQNQENNFARRISDGTTVYFSDEYAAAYDLRIEGEKESGKTIIIQQDILLTSGRNLLDFAIEAWVDKMNCELWYLDSDLEWMIIVTKENGQTKYKSSDLIQSEQIDFEFRLNQIPMKAILEAYSEEAPAPASRLVEGLIIFALICFLGIMIYLNWFFV